MGRMIVSFLWVMRGLNEIVRESVGNIVWVLIFIMLLLFIFLRLGFRVYFSRVVRFFRFYLWFVALVVFFVDLMFRFLGFGRREWIFFGWSGGLVSFRVFLSCVLVEYMVFFFRELCFGCYVLVLCSRGFFFSLV